MQHLYGIVGTALGLLGTLVLAIDLFGSKTNEEDRAAFDHDQQELNALSEQLTITMYGAMRTLSTVIKGYVLLTELDAQHAQSGAGEKATELNELMGRVRTQIGASLVESQSRFGAVDKEVEARSRIADLQRRIRERFERQVAKSKRLRWIAAAGVFLVGVGAVGQLIDFLV